MFCWTLRLRSCPEFHRLVPVGSRLYAFGAPGVSSVDFSDPAAQIEVHVLDTTAASPPLRWSAVPPAVATGRDGGGGQRPLEVPAERTGYTASPVDGVVYVWGGHPPAAPPKLWTALYAFDTGARRWSKPAASGSVPEARREHSACVFGTSVYVHGGFSVKQRRYLNTLHRLDLGGAGGAVWTLIRGGGGGGGASSATPPASAGHSATAVGGTRMFVFGGRGDADADEYRQVRAFDLRAQRWLPHVLDTCPAPPGAGVGGTHCAFTLPGAGQRRLYVLGGHGLWSFDPERGAGAWRKEETCGAGAGSAPPPAAARGAFCCCVLGDGRVAFGGCSELFVLDPRPSLATLCRAALDGRRGPAVPTGPTAPMPSEKEHKKHHDISLVLPRERPREQTGFAGQLY